MKKWKKVLIFFLVILILSGGAAGGIFAYLKYQKDNLKADVYKVSEMNVGYDNSGLSSSGTITNKSSQSITLSDNTVTKVFVAAGDKVSIGDPLLQYDTKTVDLSIEMKKLQIKGIDNNIILAQRDLDKLNAITPVDDTESTSEDTGTSDSTDSTDSESTESTFVPPAEKDGDAYNYISSTAVPYSGDGTAESPYRFLCTSDCYVQGSYINTLIKDKKVAAFEIWSDNSTTTGSLRQLWTVDGNKQSSVTDTSRYLVSTQQDMVTIEAEKSSEEQAAKAAEEAAREAALAATTEETESTETYTKDELADAIREKKSDLEDYNIDKKTAELELKGLNTKRDKLTVKSTINGMIKTVGDPAKPPSDGSPFIEVTGNEGLYVTGAISEMQLGQIAAGQSITVSSWNNGQTYEAQVTEISDYPATDNSNYAGDGNPNVSYYPFTAYVNNPEGLNIGDYVQLTIASKQDTQDMNAIFLEKAYVRKESGKYYVYKVGKDKKLVKQYVKTGKLMWGYAIEILSGLTLDDEVAFPYGKTAQEGVSVKVEEGAPQGGQVGMK